MGSCKYSEIFVRHGKYTCNYPQLYVQAAKFYRGSPMLATYYHFYAIAVTKLAIKYPYTMLSKHRNCSNPRRSKITKNKRQNSSIDVEHSIFANIC